MAHAPRLPVAEQFLDDSRYEGGLNPNVLNMQILQEDMRTRRGNQADLRHGADRITGSLPSVLDPEGLARRAVLQMGQIPPDPDTMYFAPDRKKRK